MSLLIVSSAIVAFHVSAFAAVSAPSVEKRLRENFPAMARTAVSEGGVARQHPAQLVAATKVQGFIAGQFADGYRLNNGSSIVVLRPESPQASAALREPSGMAYPRGFRGIDVFRSVRDGSVSEIFLIDGARALESIAYRVVSAPDLLELVNSGRGIRFVSRSGPDLFLSAPLTVDSAGRPSFGAEWVVDRTERGAIATLRLRLRDRSVQYPIALAYSPGQQAIRFESLRIVTTATGSLSGKVTAFGGGALGGATIYVFDSSGEFVDLATTDGSGNYSVGGLGTDNYRVLSFADGYTPQLYNNVACPDFVCSPLDGNAVSVTDGANTANINFALHLAVARITGQVTGPGPTPLENVTVVLYNGSGTPVDSANTDANGIYQIDRSSGGTFFARTLNNIYPALIDSLYSGKNCTGCNPTTGNSFTSSVGSTTSNINFALVTGGRIAGKLTDAFDASALGMRRVIIYNSSGIAVSFADSDDSGNYISFTGLVSGTYYAIASAAGYFPQLYNGIDCTGCPITGGNAISVTLGSTTSQINFALHSSLAVAGGRVSDAATGDPLGGVTVVFYNVTGNQVLATTSDFVTGGYALNLPAAGRYYARTQNGLQQEYLNQLYSGIDCSGCPPTSGTPIDVVLGVPSSNINFALNKNGGKITGSILDSATNMAVPLAFVQVFSASGDLAAYGYTDETGTYTVVDGLTSGDYYVIARAPGYVPILYSAIPCSTGCDVTTGTAVHVTRGQTTSGINFLANPTTAIIAGRVLAAASNIPLAGIGVAIFDSTGTEVSSDSTDASGNYSAVLAAGGTYFARTQNTVSPQYHDQLYDHLACETCDPTTGTPIHVADGATASNINFDLSTTTCPSIDLSPSSLPSVSVGGAYNQTITATGGAAPITFAVSTGTLPPGLGLASNGVLSGTASTSGGYNFTVRATDSNGCTGSQDYTINVAEAATTTSLTATPSTAVFGATVKLTASVNPAAATGTVSFLEGATLLGSATLASGSAFINVASFTAGIHNVSAVYNGSDDFAPSTSATIQVTIQQATPIITWVPPTSITYPTPLSGTQLNATANVPGSFVYVPPASTVLDAGSQILTANFTPADTNNYDSTSASVTLVVNKADQTIHWSNPADIVYGTALGPTQLNATVTVPGPSPAGALTYNPPAGTVLNAGTHTLNVTAAATINYNEAHASVTLNVLKATPVFSDLSAPTIVIGTPSAVITGKISAGALIPPGSVLITLNGVAQMAAIQADGTFASTFDTSALAPIAAGYPITFSYAESANFNAASGASTLTVVFATTGGPLQSGPANSGSTIPIRVQIFDAAGNNLSAADLPVIAYGVQAAGSATWLPPQSTGNSTDQLRYQNANGGSYLYTLKTTGLASGDYALGFKVADDPSIHTVSFTIR